MAFLQTDGQLFSKLVATLWHFFKLAGKFFKLAENHQTGRKQQSQHSEILQTG
jgi:hypothetical protein